MTGFCGWIAPARARSADESLDIIARMGGGLRGSRALAQRSLAGTAALEVNPSLSRATLFRDGTLLTAIDGEPRWTEPDFAHLATREGDGAALARAYRERDTALFDVLGGVFSFAIVDPDRGRAVCAIDRMGVSALYYAAFCGGFAFGSTADAVRAHPDISSTLSHQGLFDYLFFYMSPAPGTIYREQKKLIAGQYCLFEREAVTTAFYWQMPYREETPHPPERLEAGLRDTLRGAVRSAIEDGDDERYGAFLSGGLDSSTVVGLMCDGDRRPPKSFTIGFAVPGFDEMAYAEVTARHFGVRHFPLYVRSSDVAAVVPKIATAHCEPFGNSSAVPSYFCARFARENGIDTMIAGDGGDELFAGNTRYVDYDVFERYNRLPSVVRKGIVEPAVRLASLGPDSALTRKARNFVHYASIPMPDRMFARSLFGEAAAQTIFEVDFLSTVDRDGPLSGIRDIFQRTRSESLVHRLMHVDLQRTLADNDLRKVSGMCELAGVRVRYPFLDDGVVAFAAGVPGEMLLPGGELRGFYKRAFRGFLADETIRKSKHGFGLPTIQWLQEDVKLRAMALDCIAAFAARGYVRKDFISNLQASLSAGGQADHASTAWDVMMLELWLRDRRLG